MHNSRPPQRRGWFVRLAPWLYILGAVAIIPWDIYLAFTLPKHYVTPHYRGTWVIFDAAIAVAIGFVGWYAKIRNPRIVLAATAAATLLFADAWFDVSSAHGSDDHFQALMFAIFLEIPGAILFLRLAHRTLRRVQRDGAMPAADAIAEEV